MMRTKMACTCIVPHCKSNTNDAKNKLFIKVPSDRALRTQWLKLAGAHPLLVSDPNMYFCEDHFDVTKALDIYKHYISRGIKVVEKPFKILPSRFDCQKDKPEPNTSLANSDSALMRIGSIRTTTPDKSQENANEDGPAEKNARPTVDFDKFKRRLIRTVARHMFKDKTPEEEMWSELKKETGCDCQLLWKHMRSLTLKKLRRMLSAEDRVDSLTRVARFTLTDWLLFDMVLVHEKVDVIGQDTIPENGEEPKILEELFNLVNKYMIESLEGDPLVSAWMNLTLEYNGKSRQCSPMLLQRRWHQMKEASRLKFYHFWYVYRGNTRQLEKACQDGGKPTNLQLAIAKRYKNVVTEKFLEWEELINKRKVILPEAFEHITNRKSRDENIPDIEVIEPQVETIDLDEQSDSENTVTNLEDSNSNKNNLEIGFQATNDDIAELIRNPSTFDSNDSDIYLNKNELVEDTSIVDGLSNVELLESVHIPLEDDESNLIKHEPNSSFGADIIDDSLQTNTYLESMDISDSEQQVGLLMPKITSVTGAAEISNDYETVENVIKETADIFIEMTKGKIHELKKDISVTQNKDTPNDVPDNTTETLKLTSENSNSAAEAFKEDISKKNIYGDEIDELNLIGAGFQFEDDGIEFIEEETYSKDLTQIKVGESEDEQSKEKEDTPKFDVKLLLTPTVYTKKLEHMDVFKFIEYDCVKDARVIECAAAESRPIDIKAFKREDMDNVSISDPEVLEEDEDNASDSSDEEHINELKCSNWMLQKPKKRTYNPIQLCKNPDFNTRLKRLSAGFFISERNRSMLKQCKPLTIDVHKAFESKLFDGALIVKDARFTVMSAKDAINKSSIKSEIVGSPDVSADTLLNKSLEPELISLKNAIYDKVSQDTLSVERKKVISLPDIDQIRRVNQRLLTAEVTPIQASSNYRPPVELVANKGKFYLSTPPTIAPENSGTSNLVPDENKPASEGVNLIDNENTVIVDKTIEIPTKTISDDVKNARSLNNRQITKKLCDGFTMPKIKSGYFPCNSKKHEVPWLERKLHYKEYPMDDCLLASDTLYKILKVLSGESDVPETKQDKKKMAKQRVKDSEIIGNSGNDETVTQGENDEVKILAENAETTIQAENAVKQILVDKNEDALAKKKSKKKQDVSNPKTTRKWFVKKKNKKTPSTKVNKSGKEIFVALSGSSYCCWARARLAKDAQVNDHRCPTPLCYCCCRDLLIENTLTKELPKTNVCYFPPRSSALPSEPIVLSDDDDKELQKNNSNILQVPANTGVIADLHLTMLPKIDQVVSMATALNDKNIQKLRPIAPKIGNTNTNKSLIKPQSLNSNTINVTSSSTTISNNIVASSKLAITSVPLKIKTNIKAAQPQYVEKSHEVAVNLVNNVDNNSVQAKDKSSAEKIVVVSVNKHLTDTPKKNPIFIGENTILLSTIGPPNDDVQTIKKPGEEISQNVVPQGVRIILLPNGDLALSIDAGVNLDPDQMASLPAILSAIQQQINISGLNNLALNSSVNQEHAPSNDKILNDQPLLPQIQKPADIIDTPLETGANSNTIVETQNTEIFSENLEKNTTEAEMCSVNKQDETTEGENNSLTNLPQAVDIITTSPVPAESNIQHEEEDVGVTKKSILSDLMEMSGISAEDTKNLQNDTSQINRTPNVLSSPLKACSPELKMQNVYSPIVMNALATRPDLHVITSFSYLKYAVENKAEFHKLNTYTGVITAVNVCIKNKPEKEVVPKSIIDLTDDQESNLTPLPEAPMQLPKRTVTLNRAKTGTKYIKIVKRVGEKTESVKPLKMFRAVHPSILKRTKKDLEETQITDHSATENLQTNIVIDSTNRKRKQFIPINETIELDLDDDPNVNDTTTNVTLLNNTASDSDSDDEPLAKKVLRKKDSISAAEPSTLEIGDQTVEHKSTEIDDVSTAAYQPDVIESNEENMLELSPGGIHPVILELNDEESEGEDCILGF